MLELKSQIKLDQETIESRNLCDRFDEEDLKALGEWVWQGYDSDKQSRSDWERRTEAAMDLAMQIVADKNFPWANCSNVAFPLITIGVLQFHARAYPAIIQGTNVVKYRVIGNDPSGEEKARADRIATHMSWQVLEQDESWEEQQDRTLINIAVVGTAFKKSYYSSGLKHNVSELVLAKDLVLDYWAKSVEGCPRKTHVIPLFRNEIVERVRREFFRDILDEEWYTSLPAQQTSTQQVRGDKRKGTHPSSGGDETTPFQFLEQHVSVDLDQDGYAEPYIITIEETSRAVVRIVTRFDRMLDIERDAAGDIISIQPMEYFTKYPFIPSPDGGIMDIGFGVLLGPLNESTNSLINQLIDAGTMATTGGGFLGRGVKIRGGNYSFAPNEWKRVDSTGDDLRKNIYPLDVREPSTVLFQLLSLLINYTNRISGSTDIMVGENPGQNTPAETSRTMVEMGQKIYSGIFKRVWRSMKEEFRKLYILNGIHLPEVVNFGSVDKIGRKDYLGDPSRIVPVADPNITSDSMQLMRAQTVKQAAMVTPGYNLVEVEKDYLRALKIDGIDRLYPGPDKVPPLPNPKMAAEQIKLQAKQMDLKLKQQQFLMELMETRRLNSAKILQLEAQAAKLLQEAKGVDMGHQIAAFEASIGALKVHDESLRGHIELAMKGMENEREATSEGGVGGMAESSGDKGAEKGNAAPA